MWDQSLHGFHSGASEEVTGHFLLMKSFIPYLENVKGGTINAYAPNHLHGKHLSQTNLTIHQKQLHRLLHSYPIKLKLCIFCYNKGLDQSYNFVMMMR